MFQVVDGQFQLSFTYRFPEQKHVLCYFAFCYPYSYEEIQQYLHGLENKLKAKPSNAIYYHRELICKSIDDLRVDLITVSSSKGILEDVEPRLAGLFPDLKTKRAKCFNGKKVNSESEREIILHVLIIHIRYFVFQVFILTSRVHPGETPSSYVFKGFLDFITRAEDPRAAALRDRFVFKLIPLLNPDGVKRGHYRTDQRGVNLNRVYLDPNPDLHPTIFAAKSLIAYHYNGVRSLGHGVDGGQPLNSQSPDDLCPCAGKDVPSQASPLSLQEKQNVENRRSSAEISVQGNCTDAVTTGCETKVKKSLEIEADYNKNVSSTSTNGPNTKTENCSPAEHTRKSSELGLQKGLSVSDLEADSKGEACIMNRIESSEGSDSACDNAKTSDCIPDNTSVNNNCAGSDEATLHGKDNAFPNNMCRLDLPNNKQLEEGACGTNASNVKRQSNCEGYSATKTVAEPDYDRITSARAEADESTMARNTATQTSVKITDDSSKSISDKVSNLSLRLSRDALNTDADPLSNLNASNSVVKAQEQVASNATPPGGSNYSVSQLTNKSDCIPCTTDSTNGISQAGDARNGVATDEEISKDTLVLKMESSAATPARESKEDALNPPQKGANPHTTIQENPPGNQVTSGVDKVNEGSLGVTDTKLAFYVDLHGHASKRGCFMYGNYFEDEESYVQCMLFPKLISINSSHFDFAACNFTEKNMYSRDKRDGMSKEGSGRVAAYKMTGLPYW